jgi:Arc/MetJ-type ribon-helix-helix transcriptional regulator
MKRTTVSLPDDLAWLLEREAKRHDTSASEIVRQALTHHFGIKPEGTRRLPFANLGHYEGPRRAADMEQILRDEWRTDRTRDR